MKSRLSSCCAAAILCMLPLTASAQQAIGEVYATDATVKGSVILAGGGTRLMSGSSVTAGSATAVLKLARGGEVRVCSNTSISVASSPSGRDLLLGMGTGAIETHYDLGASTDSLLTPDLRIQLPGPGGFHLAFGADSRGNTCIRSLPSNTAAVIVTELMGDGSYQVKPAEEVRFAGGRVSAASADAGDCGCPAPPPPVIKTEAPAPAEPKKVESAVVAQATSPSETKLTAPPPPADPGQLHIVVDAPFVFSAADPAPLPPPAVVSMDLSSLPMVPQPQVSPPPPPPPLPQQAAKEEKKKPERRGFFGKLRGFLASVFRG
jgi:hypothetical protein